MPTYEYRCTEGHAFEQIQKMSELPITVCPVCGAAAMRSISGGAGLIFKGSGFYITDYGKDGKGARKDNDGAPAVEAKADTKSDATSDAKREPRADTKAGDKPAPKGEGAPPATPKTDPKSTPKADPS